MTKRPDLNQYAMHPFALSRMALIAVSLAIGCLSVGAAFLPGWAYEPKLDMEAPLKPLVDTYQPGAARSGEKPVEGHEERDGMVPVNESPPSEKKPLVLTGKVQTLQQAIESERATVDWYAWYLSAREYLWRTGGLR